MKRAISLFLALVLICLTAPAGLAASGEAEAAAELLHELGLFRGVGTNPDGTPDYALDRGMTRAEAVTMLVRLLGREEEALAGVWETPFADVADWAAPYVGYAYARGLTNGVGADRFGGGDTVSAVQFLTFLLRALGYSSETDFRWDEAWELTDRIGVTSGDYGAETPFTRGDAAVLCCRALSARLNGEERTLLSLLRAAGKTAEPLEAPAPEELIGVWRGSTELGVTAELELLEEGGFRFASGDDGLTAAVLCSGAYRLEEGGEIVFEIDSLRILREGRVTEAAAEPVSVPAGRLGEDRLSFGGAEAVRIPEPELLLRIAERLEEAETLQREREAAYDFLAELALTRGKEDEEGVYAYTFRDEFNKNGRTVLTVSYAPETDALALTIRSVPDTVTDAQGTLELTRDSSLPRRDCRIRISWPRRDQVDSKALVCIDAGRFARGSTLTPYRYTGAESAREYTRDLAPGLFRLLLTRTDELLLGPNGFTLKDLGFTSMDAEDTGDASILPEDADAYADADDDEFTVSGGPYAYLAGVDLRSVRLGYPSAAPLEAYVTAYIDARGHLIVLTDLWYRIITDWNLRTYRDMTVGELVRNPEKEWDARIRTALGQRKEELKAELAEILEQFELARTEGVRVGPEEMEPAD